MAYDGRWFARVHLINGGDGSNGVSCPGCSVDHCIPLHLVIPVLFRYLLHPDAKPNSHETMVVVLVDIIPRHDIRSHSNAHNWTSRNEMPHAAAFPAVSSRGDVGGEGGGGKEGGRAGVGGPGQIASDSHTPSHQSVSTGTAGDWRVGMSMMIGLARRSSTGGVGTHVGAGVKGGGGGE